MEEKPEQYSILAEGDEVDCFFLSPTGGAPFGPSFIVRRGNMLTKYPMTEEQVTRLRVHWRYILANPHKPMGKWGELA